MTFWSEKTLPKPFDEKRADAFLSDLQADAEAEKDTLFLKRLKKGKNVALMRALSGNSPYLAHLMLRNPVFTKKLLAGDPDNMFEDLLEKTARKAAKTHKEKDFKAILRGLKGRGALLIAAADISKHWPLEQTTEALSRLADLCLQLSLSHILRDYMVRGTLPWPKGKPEPAAPELAWTSGFVVFSLGKLGSRSLNYSSDVDLVLIYDETKSHLVDQLPKPFFTKVAQRLVTLMQDRTEDGYCFRVDLRLRPDPGTTPPAVSFSAAEVYYQSQAETWERAAMIKARISAGDMEVGAFFLESLRHFVWRRHLDYAAVEDIHAIKERIFRHYGHGKIRLEGHDLKVGEGGIRSIEFFAQIHQLIAGGRNPGLRRRGTINALSALNRAGIIESTVAQQLSDSYRFLRTVEHRLQMINDEQTQKLPSDTAGMKHLATFLGFDDVDTFKTRMLGTLSLVKRHYDTLPGVAEDKALPDFLKSTEALERRLFSWGFSENAGRIIEGWSAISYRALKTPRARRIFQSLLPEILESFSRSSNPDQALERFDDFLSKLPSGVQILALFQNNPWVFQVIGKILTLAPNLAGELARRPDLLDFLLNPTFFDTPGDKTALKAALGSAISEALSYEDVLNLTRLWLNEMRFQAGLHLLEGLTSSAEAGRHRANMAETVLETLLPHVKADFEATHGVIEGGQLAAIALGSFGARELTAGSDLDLVLLYDAPEDARASGPRGHSASQYYIRLGQHLLTALSAMMGSGSLYEVDLRLRPSGRWGPLVVSLESFLEYQKNSAWTVEHMALTRARPVLGDEAIQKKIKKAIFDICTMERNPAELQAQMREVRQKYFEEHGTENIFGVRQVKGGLIDVEYIVQFHALSNAHRHPEIYPANFGNLLKNLNGIKAIDKKTMKLLQDAHDFYIEVHGLLRLCHKENPDPDTIAPALLSLMATLSGSATPDGLKTRILETQKTISALYQKTFNL